MKLHSTVDIITNSSTEIFTIRTDLPDREFEAILRTIWLFSSKKTFPFNITNIGDGYEFDAGYYWNFSQYPAEDGEYDYGEAEREKFLVELSKVFPDYDSYEVG